MITILGAPCYNYCIMCPKTLFQLLTPLYYSLFQHSSLRKAHRWPAGVKAATLSWPWRPSFGLCANGLCPWKALGTLGIQASGWDAVESRTPQAPKKREGSRRSYAPRAHAESKHRFTALCAPVMSWPSRSVKRPPSTRWFWPSGTPSLEAYAIGGNHKLLPAFEHLRAREFSKDSYYPSETDGKL